jgi:LMBR1 domain-containing protein 1
MAVDYVVYAVVAVIVGILVLVGCVVFIIKMQHPDDRLTAWLPKIIVLLGLFLACSVVLLLPFDASMSQSCQQDPNCPATQGLAQLWYAAFISIAIMAFVIIPLAYFW